MRFGRHTRTMLDLDDRALIEASGSSASSCGPAASSSTRAPIRRARSRLPGRHGPSGRREILAANGSDDHDRGIKAEARTVLLRSIALGRRWLDEVLGGTSVDQIAARERCTKRHVINTIPLAFLAPEDRPRHHRRAPAARDQHQEHRRARARMVAAMAEPGHQPRNGLRLTSAPLVPQQLSG